MQAGAHIGRYELVARLGEGAMGEVWEAILHGPHGFRRVVALKLLRVARDRQALIREARLGAMLSHPNVVGVHDLGEADGVPYVAMELVRGATARDLVLGSALDSAAVVDLGIQVATGLAHIHALEVDGHPAGLIHRDIKPGNLLVDRTGLVKIADLGIARLAGDGDHFAGTPAYHAPEQAHGHEDARADQFALGATLFVLATQRRPFGRGKQAMQRIQRADAWLHEKGLLAKLDTIVPGLGPIVGRCLRHDPDARYANAEDLAVALRGLYAGLEPGGNLAQAVAVVRPDLAAEGSVSVFPSGGRPRTPTVAVARGNLPASIDLFVGREDDLAHVIERVDCAVPVVTLLGPGGMGKTRLALEAGRALAQRLEGGAWFCDLSEARTAEGLCIGVANALGVELTGNDPVGQVGHALRALGPALIIFDNLESCIGVASEVVSRWTRVAGEAHLLATSRIALRLQGEERIALGPLPVDQAVDLFQRRAIRPAPAVDLPALRALVAGLDGMPLAIELAAARTRLLTVPRILSHLHRRFELLAGGGSDRPIRHRSLRASLEGSWELLAPWEQAALAQLSVFADGFTLADAEAVLNLHAWPVAPWSLDVLEVLTDHSLVRFVVVDDRFRMLESVRVFAAEYLEDPLGVEARHRAWFAQLGTPAALSSLVRQGGTHRLRQLGAHRGNLVVAVLRGIAARDGVHTGALALAAAEAMSLTGPDTAVLDLLDGAASLAGERRAEVLLAALTLARTRSHALAETLLQQATASAAGSARVRAAVELAWVRHGLETDRDEAARHLLRAEALIARGGLVELHGEVLQCRAMLLMDAGSGEDALRVGRRALSAHRTQGDVRREAKSLRFIGNLLFDLGRMDEAATHFQGSLTLYRDLGSQRAAAGCVGALAKVYDMLGQRVEARSHYEVALATHRRVGNRASEASTITNLGLLEAKERHHDEAFAYYRSALEIHREVGNRRSEGIVLGNIGALCRETGDLQGARTHLEQAIEQFESMGAELPLAVYLDHLARVEQALGQVPAALQASDRSVVLLRNLGARGHLANALCTRTELYIEADKSTLAHACLTKLELVLGELGPAGDATSQRADELRRRLMRER